MRRNGDDGKHGTPADPQVALISRERPLLKGNLLLLIIHGARELLSASERNQMMDPSEETGDEGVQPGLQSSTACFSSLRNDAMQLPATTGLVHRHERTTAVTLFTRQPLNYRTGSQTQQVLTSHESSPPSMKPAQRMLSSISVSNSL